MNTKEKRAALQKVAAKYYAEQRAREERQRKLETAHESEGRFPVWLILTLVLGCIACWIDLHAPQTVETSAPVECHASGEGATR